jgi:hypothetical protein
MSEKKMKKEMKKHELRKEIICVKSSIMNLRKQQPEEEIRYMKPLPLKLESDDDNEHKIGIFRTLARGAKKLGLEFAIRERSGIREYFIYDPHGKNSLPYEMEEKGEVLLHINEKGDKYEFDEPSDFAVKSYNIHEVIGIAYEFLLHGSKIPEKRKAKK